MKSKESTQSIYPMVDLEAAFNSINASLYDDEFACELLAWFHVCGANNEAVVLNRALSSALMVCAKKLGFEGGKTPDQKLFVLWKEKVGELKDAIAASDELEKEGSDLENKPVIEPDFPEWLERIVERYGLRMPRKKFDF